LIPFSLVPIGFGGLAIDTLVVVTLCEMGYNQTLIEAKGVMPHDTANQPSSDPQLLLQQLHDENWLVRATAAFNLRNSPEATIPAIARFFELSLDDHAPLRDICQAAIENMKSSAIPFLLRQASADHPTHRERAIELLAVVGECGGQPHQFATQVLGPRNAQRPGWGDCEDLVLQTVAHALSDPTFSVRFAAASVCDDCNHLVEQTIPVFIEALRKGTSFQKNWAALRLGRIGAAARIAQTALSELAAGVTDPADVWDDYAHLAAKVALERIGQDCHGE
jgi:HEAT repeat protein